MTTTATSPAHRAVANVESFLAEVRPTLGKSAEANTETGSQGGATTHPVKSVEDNTRPATEGARSAENTKDVKKDQGKPSVDSTPEATAKKADELVATGNSGDGGTASEDQIQIGTKKGPTGTNVPAVKNTKDDPGTSHQARTDNDALNGGKYAADLEKMSFDALATEYKELGNSICAALVMDQPAAHGKQAAAQSVQVDPKVAQAAGYELAGLMTGNMDKQAVDTVVHNALIGIIKEAEEDATRLANFLTNYKQAEEPIPGQGGGGGGGGGDASGGGDPAAQAGGAEAGAGGADGSMSEEELMALLQQLGISPEEFQAAIAAEQGGGAAGGGGMPPGGDPAAAGGAAMPPGAAGGMPPPQGGMQVAAGDKLRTMKEAAAVINEIVGRSRAKQAAVKLAAAAVGK